MKHPNPLPHPRDDSTERQTARGSPDTKVHGGKKVPAVFCLVPLSTAELLCLVELSSTSALDNLEIASICGHRKECAHWLPEKEALGSLFPASKCFTG